MKSSPPLDKDKKVRDAIIFKLRPVGSLSPDSANVEAALASEVGPGNKGAVSARLKQIVALREPRSTRCGHSTNVTVGRLFQWKQRN
jgi:hypothetical protein